jgi:hypothetical protein
MKLKTEIIEEKQKALIISKTNYHFIKIIKSHLKNFSVEPYFSSYPTKSFKIFNYVFSINTSLSLETIKNNQQTKFVFFFLKNKLPSFLLKNNLNNIKIIIINSYTLQEKDIDRILWFSFSQSKEKILTIDHLIKKEEAKPKKANIFYSFLTKKNLIKLVLISFFAWFILYLPFTLISYFFIFQTYKEFKNENLQKITNNLKQAKIFFQPAKKIYQTSASIYKLLGISTIPETLIDINEKSIEVFQQLEFLLKTTKDVSTSLLIKNKDLQEKNSLKIKLTLINQKIDQINTNLDIISQKLDFPLKKISDFKNKLIEVNDTLSKSKRLFQYFQKIVTQEKNSKYLIFFANNMELRPGGGFIGSFAVIEIGNFEIGQLKVYDVYDADGQLTAHLDPPKPLEKYLSLPHWFLRDSNFSPDFLENYQKALFFLDNEMKFKDFDGGILLTTTAVENILTAFGDLYLPDYKEYVNSKNFYLKTQSYVEKKFFPGSIQKQTFLSKLVNQLFISFDQASMVKLLSAIKKSLDEKQFVVYLNDENIQAFFDSSFWSGRVINPRCLLNESNCILDYVFPYEANVGANKANFFINRFFYFKTSVDLLGKINHLLTIKYENQSPAEIFPTGYYRNYFQVMLPKNSIIKNIIKDGVLVEDYEQKDDIFKLIGFYFEIPPKKTTEIKIDYQLEDSFKKGRQIYQLIFQKQIGAKNSDLILDYRFNQNFSLINQNFSPLVKNNQIIYNTSLSTDKIFLIEVINK